MNHVQLSGNLANDPEFRTTQSGISQLSFRLAVQRRFTNAEGKREADFIQVQVWRKLAEVCNDYLKKGSRVNVSGVLQSRSYEAQDGSRRYVTEVVADEVDFLNRVPNSAPTDKDAPPERRADNSNSGFTEYDDDSELPF